MRIKREYRMASKEVYQKFRVDNPGLKISFLEWANIIYTFNYSVRDHILETGEIFKLPWGFGELVISKKKRKKFIIDPTGKERINLAIDWQKTKKAGKKIYHFNSHTDGFSFKWKWFTRTARFKDHDLWVFKPSRISSRLLKHYISQDYASKYNEWHSIKR